MSKLIIINNDQNRRDVYREVYERCLSAYRNNGDVMLDFTAVNEISIEGAKEIFGKLLIKDKCKTITCKSLSNHLFMNIARGIVEYFRECYPQGMSTRFGSKIMEPQVEMSGSSLTWCTIQLGDEVTMLLSNK